MAYEGGGLSSLVCHLFGIIPDGWGGESEKARSSNDKACENMFYSMFCLKIVK